jgi:hypothetical protein
MQKKKALTLIEQTTMKSMVVFVISLSGGYFVKSRAIAIAIPLLLIHRILSWDEF